MPSDQERDQAEFVGARRMTAAEEKALAKVEPGKPRTLGQFEKIVRTNVVRGAGYWRVAADALMQIRDQKLWKKAKDKDGEPFPNFATYAEERFGFKKTYAYDLVKAARRKPEAVTEGEARGELKSERGAKALQPYEASSRIARRFAAFLDAAGNLRDRAIEHANFVQDYDQLAKSLMQMVDAFDNRYPEPVEGTAEEVEKPSSRNSEGTATVRNSEGEPAIA
jgi:hypothetical protein